MILLSSKNLQLFLNLPSSKNKIIELKNPLQDYTVKKQHHVDPSMTYR